MKMTCLVLLMSGIVPLIQGSSASAAIERQKRSARQVQQSLGSDSQPSGGSPSGTIGGSLGSTIGQVTATASQLLGSVANLDFGNVSINSASLLGVTLTNSGSADIAISNVSVSGPGFDAGGIPAGTILSAGQSAILTVSFSPASSGNASGSVTVTSDAASSSVVINLSAVGAQPVSTTISILPADQTIAVGDQLQFKAVDNQGNDVTASVLWTSSDASVVSITPSGLASGMAAGPATIAATE